MADNAELESFRRQWREEVLRRTKPSQPGSSQATPSRAPTTQSRQFPPTRHEAFARKEDEEEEEAASPAENEISQGVEQLSLTKPDEEDGFYSRTHRTEPTSALEHFERAVEREAEGNLGDSLQHYRKAYRVRQITLPPVYLGSWLTDFHSLTLASIKNTGTNIMPALGRRHHRLLPPMNMPKLHQLSNRRLCQHRNSSLHLLVLRSYQRTPYLRATRFFRALLRTPHPR
jgi:hypothetical protein